jgi:hypothetical protein
MTQAFSAATSLRPARACLCLSEATVRNVNRATSCPPHHRGLCAESRTAESLRRRCPATGRPRHLKLRPSDAQNNHFGAKTPFRPDHTRLICRLHKNILFQFSKTSIKIKLTAILVGFPTMIRRPRCIAAYGDRFLASSRDDFCGAKKMVNRYIILCDSA